MREPQSWGMLARYLANEASPEEAKEVQAWMASDPENQLMVQKLKASFSIAAAEDEVSDLNVLWSKIAHEIGRSRYGLTRATSRHSFVGWLRHFLSPQPVLSFRSLLLPAAAMVGVLALAWIPYQFFWKSPDMVEADVPLREQMTVDLNDGTRVVLDAGSQLQYPEQFADNSRHVVLRGQGYFQVARDAARPFVVTAGHGEIEVLGTAFDVQSWDSSLVIVTVEEGRVKFERARGGAGQSVVLEARQSSTLGSSGGPTPPATVDVTRLLAWMRDEIFCDDVPLSAVLDRLRRWHNVEISVSDPALLDERLTLHLVKSDMQGSLELVTRLLGLNVVGDANSYRLVRRSDEVN
jgi:ferric-dicitrate binding protein FerR (iron transport regulator)